MGNRALTQQKTVLVIFGGSGDLTRRKLMPALFQLGCKSRLPEGLSIIGFARPEMTNDEYREMMWEGAREFGDLAVREDDWRMFEQRISYVSGDLTRLEDFVNLKRDLLDFEEDFQPPNCLFYLSIAPQFSRAPYTTSGPPVSPRKRAAGEGSS